MRKNVCISSPVGHACAQVKGCVSREVEGGNKHNNVCKSCNFMGLSLIYPRKKWDILHTQRDPERTLSGPPSDPLFSIQTIHKLLINNDLCHLLEGCRLWSAGGSCRVLAGRFFRAGVGLILPGKQSGVHFVL